MCPQTDCTAATQGLCLFRLGVRPNMLGRGAGAVCHLYKHSDFQQTSTVCALPRPAGAEIGKGVVRRSGRDVAVLAYGSSVNEALTART